MSLTKQEVESVAKLARLKITEGEIERVVEKLSSIIDFVDQLQAANTDDVMPMAHPLDMGQRLRTDEISESDQRKRYQVNASEVEAGLYLVPKVIE
ncbi:MAG: Asp-tRNA(Asn)/Glu-tRNA(Gln) amidotransferase subunit GatC [Gammaproteobacteria bacterium]|nr:Asp-tRNA(Asn)/Glu-tRNA(Gln) amidotransferase subunit GatC [Gammaproteobacteria bacterium]